MATVYSLICWGGLTGKSVSGATATDILTLTNHGLLVGTKVVAQSTVSGVVAGTTYYVYPITASTFYLYDTLANAQAGGTTGRIDITATTAFVLKSDLVANPATALSAYGLSDLSRWGSTRIYDGLNNAVNARLTVALPGDDEVIEFVEAFDDIRTSTSGTTTANFSGASFTFVSRVNGIRTAAFHGGVVGAGYRHVITVLAVALNISSYNNTVDGLQFVSTSSTSGNNGLITTNSTGANPVFVNNIVGHEGTGEQIGISIGDGVQRIGNNIVYGFKGTTYAGISSNLAAGALVYNNLVTKCGVGIKALGCQGLWHNNISVGNTINWTKSAAFTTFRAFGNIGSLDDQYVVTVTSGTTTLTCSTIPTAAALAYGSRIFFASSGSLPTVAGVALNPNFGYFIRSVTGSNFTISTTYGGAELTFDSAGSGTHKLSLVWGSGAAPLLVDFSTPNDIFKDWANNDFRPAGTGATPNPKALQVDTYVDVYGVNLTTDIAGNERPNYNNGGFEANDVGPFEYDHGYGPHPASNTLTLTNVVVGSRVLIRDQANTTTHYDQIAASSTVSTTITLYGDSRDNWKIKVRKASATPFYQPWETLMTATAGSSSIYVSQIPDE